MMKILFALCVLVGLAQSASAQDAGRPPNIIYILADDLGWAELGCYGQEKIRTPHIDRIAADGIRFTQHYSGSPVCAPSRCVLLTGKHPGHAYVRNNWEAGGWGPDEREGQKPLPAGTETAGRMLQRAGYRTGCFGKWGLGGPGTSGAPEFQGFDRFYGYLCQRVAHNFYPTHLWSDGERVELDGNTWGNLVGEQYSHDLIADEALRFIRDNSDQPFFCFVPFTIPHLAIQVPEDSLAEYEGKWDDPPYDGKKGYLAHPAPRAGYAAMVTRMDRDVGRIVALIDELGLAENTIIFFSSDNGATFDIGGADSPFFESAGPLRGRKGSVWEGGIRVPLVARWTGHIPAGSESAHLSAFWDMLPTFAELARVKPAVSTDGISMLPTLLGDDERQREHEALYWEFPGYGGQQAVRLGPWKAVRRNMKRGNEEIQLFNLDADIGETKNVAGEHPDVMAEIRRILEREHVPSEEFPMPILDDEG